MRLLYRLISITLFAAIFSIGDISISRIYDINYTVCNIIY